MCAERRTQKLLTEKLHGNVGWRRRVQAMLTAMCVGDAASKSAQTMRTAMLFTGD